MYLSNIELQGIIRPTTACSTAHCRLCTGALTAPHDRRENRHAQNTIGAVQNTLGINCRTTGTETAIVTDPKPHALSCVPRTQNLRLLSTQHPCAKLVPSPSRENRVEQSLKLSPAPFTYRWLLRAPVGSVGSHSHGYREDAIETRSAECRIFHERHRKHVAST